MPVVWGGVTALATFVCWCGGPLRLWPALEGQSKGTVALTDHHVFHSRHHRWSMEEKPSPMRKDVEGTINSGEHPARDDLGMAQKKRREQL